MKYCRVSGQRINELKSSIIFNSGADPVICKEIEEVLHIINTRDPGKYLGLPTVWGISKKRPSGS